MLNLNLIQECINNMQDKFNEVYPDENKSVEVITYMREQFEKLVKQEPNVPLSVRFPNIACDIKKVAEGMSAEGEKVDISGNMEYLIEKVLDYNYSDYNDDIEEMIEELINAD